MTVSEQIEKEIEGLKVNHWYALCTDELESFFKYIIEGEAFYCITRAFSLGYIRGQKALKAEQKKKALSK